MDVTYAHRDRTINNVHVHVGGTCANCDPFHTQTVDKAIEL